MARSSLIYHEFNHFDSPLGEYYKANEEHILEKADKLLSKKGDLPISKIDVYMGIVAIEEVLAQWLAERTIAKKEKVKKMYNVSILGNCIECESDFDLDEIYRPLQQYVEMFISEIGYEDIENFARNLYGEQINFDSFVTTESIEMLGYVGKMCKGVYKENEFWNSVISTEDIKNTIKYFESKDKKSKKIIKPIDIVETEKCRKISKSVIDRISNFFNKMLERLNGKDTR